MTLSDHDIRLRRLRFRAWHRGTREADYCIGGFIDRFGSSWTADEVAWFEALVEETDADILDWAFGRAEPPAHYDGAMIAALRRLDYVQLG